MLKHRAMCLLVVLLLTLFGSPAREAGAQQQPQGSAPAVAPTQPGGLQVYGISQEDTNNDGVVDLTIIECAIETPRDRVLVFDGAGNMRTSDRWEEATDFVDDTWVFDIGGNGARERAALIIAFSRDEDDTLAHIYDGSTTDGVVRYEGSGSGFRVIQPEHPAMIIRASGYWTRPDGGLNYNLAWQYDGPAASREYAPVYPYAFVLDGDADLEGAAGDDDGDGVPEYSWYTLTAPVPASERIPRSSISANTAFHRPDAPTRTVFWPLLNRPDNPQGRNYYATPLFLGVDWRAGLITSFGFLGYPIEEGYHVNSLSGIVRGEVNSLSFENPMAYYDLAGDRDGRPELFIRVAYTPPGDEYFLTGGPTRDPMQMVQISWNQKNHEELRWDYKVDVAGRNAISQTVRVGEMLVEQIPHDRLPAWAVSQAWGLATLVAYETGNGYLSSEGIYDWSTLEGVQSYGGIYAGSTVSGVESYTSSNAHPIPRSEQVQRDYLGGVSADSPAGLYSSMLAGFRGEYADVDGPVWLYFSPIDARLHLAGANHGIYNAGNNRRVEYENLDSDAYIDSWRVFRGDEEVAGLRQASRFLVYNETDRIVLVQATVAQESFRTQPPVDRREWADLGDRLSTGERDFAPDDLAQMLQHLLEQSRGATSTLTGARLRDYRPTGDGFRFVLDLLEGYTASGDMLPVHDLEPGVYVVEYEDGFTVRPWSPPAISAEILAPTLTEGEMSAVPVVVRNAGLQDVPRATVELWSTAPSGESSLVASRTADLHGESDITLRFVWAPTSLGEWDLALRVIEPAGAKSPESSLLFDSTAQREGSGPRAEQVMVAARAGAVPSAVFEATASPLALASSMLALGSAALLAGWAVWKHWGATMTKRRNDDARR